MSVMVDLVENGRVRKTTLELKRCYNLGSATRKADTAIAHQDEVKKIGIAIAFDIPAPRIYPIGADNITAAGEITVQGEETSGEVEIVIVVTDDIYVGVGSDHTDRALERTSIVWSKQACANVLAPKLWRWSDVKDRWDSFVMRSWVDGRLYQECLTEVFLSPEAMLDVLKERVADLPARDFCVFGGTVAALNKSIGFGRRWEFEMAQPDGDAIRHGYDVVNLMNEIKPGFRVPLEKRL
ncbi:conserved hypothetical protein [Hyphomicrobiales bacterium]|nr:conserved hypothetical protein [Hyphomicrobiales bacterium]CAH1663700.1 conserved hypothetical protein [Hyphomicrobiales bacterium]